MPYAYTAANGRTYYLHRKTVTLSNGRPAPVYYFAGRPKPGETLEAVPAGYTVVEPSRAARPSLRKLAPAGGPTPPGGLPAGDPAGATPGRHHGASIDVEGCGG